MNRQIEKLAKQAGLKIECWMINPPKPFQILGSTEQFEKFVELIMLQSVDKIIKDTANWSGDEGTMAYYQGVQDSVKSIRNHFGVKE